MDNLDELVRVAEKDVRMASDLLVEVIGHKLRASLGQCNDWPDILAQDFAKNLATSVSEWADAHGLAAETVSRGLSKAYGVAPECFRAEVKTKAAWFRITQSSDRLGTIATETGFADQSHMTRWVHRVAGFPPRAWRRVPQSAQI